MRILSFIITSCLLSLQLLGQPVPLSKFGTYSIVGEELIFEFNPKTYKAMLIQEGFESADFYDLNLVKAAKDYRNWQSDGWTMTKVKKNLYQIRKPFSEIKDSPNWLLRLESGRKQWIGIGGYEFPEKPEESGSNTERVRFFLNGYPDAKKVYLAGFFNRWDPESIPMTRVENGWEFFLDLKPGRYEYKFVVDQEWMHDPMNPMAVENEHGTLNSVLLNGIDNYFYLNGYQEAKKVLFACELNDWNRAYEMPLTKTETGWGITVNLVPGKMMYKFIVDGEWMMDPVNPLTEKTWNGYENCVRIVRVKKAN